MTQGYERPDVPALNELGGLLQHLGEELAVWRRRSLKAEAELGEARARGGMLAGPEMLQARQRVVELEVESQAFRARIDAARDRLALLASRLRFLQQDADEGAA